MQQFIINQQLRDQLIGYLINQTFKDVSGLVTALTQLPLAATPESNQHIPQMPKMPERPRKDNHDIIEATA